MSEEKPRIYRKDYRPPSFIIRTAELSFDLDFDLTTVSTRLNIVRNDENSSTLILNGEDLDLKEVKMDGTILKEGDDYKKGLVAGEPQSITISGISKKEMCIEIVQANHPSKNTMLSGVYKSNEILISHNEPHGMRRICYWIDRPDNMTIYTVKLTGDKATYPVLLSNGDQKHYEELSGGRHTATFVDPWPKGPHLFAICAGKLEHIEGKYRTMEGRDVTLQIYAEPPYAKQLDWALEVTRQSFKFDEEQYGRAYDLDVFRVVGVSDFNMGAMENKSLCVFNISALVASPAQSADRNYNRVLTVIGHEYFHNWSGNRVNVRDWFQITLKEGFTKYRETEFEAWYYGAGISRLGRVNMVRERQFAEDAGSNSHPIRPESYVDVDNFYTATLYCKGAEVIGMYKALLGPDGYRKGTDYYFSTYDGQAVSCDEFRNAMATANGRDLSQFELWYTQRRTPRIQVTAHGWKKDDSTYRITLKQILPPDADPQGGEPKAMLIPILFGLVSKTTGADLVGSICLELKTWEEEFSVPGVTEDCVPSVLRKFSSPVILEDFLSEEDVLHLMGYDSDDFNRWEAGRGLAAREIIRRATDDKNLGSPLPEALSKAYRAILARAQKQTEYGMVAECMSPPSPLDICNRYPGNDPYKLALATVDLKLAMRKALEPELKVLYEKIASELKAKPKDPFDTSAQGVSTRALSGVLLGYMCSTDDQKEMERLVEDAYFNRNTITEKEHAFIVAAGMKDCDVRNKLVEAFHAHCKGFDENTLDAWFILQASGRGPLVAERVLKLTEHPDYKDATNPNRIRSLLTTTLINPASLLEPSGEVINWVTSAIMRLDKFNPRVAAVASKLLAAFTTFDSKTQDRCREACKVIYDNGNCSFSCKEILEPVVKPTA